MAWTSGGFAACFPGAALEASETPAGGRGASGRLVGNWETWNCNRFAGLDKHIDPHSSIQPVAFLLNLHIF